MKTHSDPTSTIDIGQLRRLFPASDIMIADDGFCVIDMRYDSCLSILTEPCRFDGFLIFFCISGNVRIMINLKEFEVTENSLFINFPGDIITVPGMDESQKDRIHFIVMAMTSDYMAGLDMNMPQLMTQGISVLGNPCYMLTEEERSIAKKYLSLASDVLRSNLSHKKECITALFSSLFYLDGSVIERGLGMHGALSPTGKKPDRKEEIFHSFISLVSEYHTKERGVAFYADRMCLTPKYLSKTVRAVSGRLAPEWIDAYVMLEARNLLKYSDLPIKGIAGRLNFANSSAFLKFFKARMGITPLQYRKKG